MKNSAPGEAGNTRDFDTRKCQDSAWTPEVSNTKKHEEPVLKETALPDRFLEELHGWYIRNMEPDGTQQVEVYSQHRRSRKRPRLDMKLSS